MKEKIDYYKPLKRQLRALNRYLDEDYKKLSDRFDNLKLSHNRKKKALERLRNIFDNYLFTLIDNGCWMTDKELELYRKICDDALWCDGRERMKPFKMKGGRQCA